MFPAKGVGLFNEHRVTSERVISVAVIKCNKVSKSVGIRKVEHTYHFQKCADAIYQKLSKLVHACRNYRLPKLACFFRDTV